jgi:16S rRNA (adenine1518-N6/adenine1519-N6)-dimethyltransferase
MRITANNANNKTNLHYLETIRIIRDYSMKRLGQHFLREKEFLKKIVDALELRPDDVVIEIGAGHGEITFPLLEECELRGCKKIIAIERDPRLAVSLELLAFRGGAKKKLQIVKGDIRQMLPPLTKSYKLKPKSFKLVGNIPYYLTGYLLRLIGELEHKPRCCVFTLQREVAERLTLGPPKMNKLAASVQFWAEPEVLALIPKRYFRPQPKVDAAVVRLTTREDTRLRPPSPDFGGQGGQRKPASAQASADREEREKYYKAVTILFRQPRKTILNNLAYAGGREDMRQKLLQVGIDPMSRPQNLAVSDIRRIASVLGKEHLP